MSRFQAPDGRGEPKKEWPAVVCGQFRSNPQLARGELFGYRKGAFTGADRDHPGLLEQADGDCLFLDEIADLDRDTQRLLMGALEGRGFRRLGETQVRTARFRLICATNRPLEALRGEALDEDFYDRISVFVLRVPPLRSCTHDLPHIWRRVWRDVGQRASLTSPELAHHDALLRALAAHPLPGNLRDLQRIAWHLAASTLAGEAPDAAVRAALEALNPEGGPAPFAQPDLALQLPLTRPLPELLREQRLRWTEAALSRAGGNQSEAARLLGVKRETFKEWARDLNGEKSPPHGDDPPPPAEAEPAA